MKSAERIVNDINTAARARDLEGLRRAALNASKFLRSRLSEAAYLGDCHHCDEAESGEPCHWCGLVSPEK